jgi:hypothetical protein
MLCIVNKVIPAKAGIQALLPGVIEQLRNTFWKAGKKALSKRCASPLLG